MTPMHLLCAPFPSPQGTQAAVAAMLRAERDAGTAPRLLAYAERFGDVDAGIAVERLPAVPLRVGARSGPSLARVAHDAAAVVALAARARADGARTPMYAHNVEAAIACAIAGVPYVYVAHTSMRDELPSYGTFGPFAPRLGDALDRAAASQARAIAAIVPSLRASLAKRLGRTVAYLPVPWPVADVADDRAAARHALGLADDAIALLHAGNLDAYQGLEKLMDVAIELGRARSVVVLVATASEPRACSSVLAARGIAHRFLPLASEADRARAHAAADVALIVRSVPHGLPIKLLEALARGVPVVTTALASGGLPLRQAAMVEGADDASTLARACLRACGSARTDLIRDGRAYLGEHHSPEAYRFAEHAIGEIAGAAGRRSRA